MKTIKRQAATILAMYLGWDLTELKDNWYQPYTTDKKVYTVGEDYYCIVRKGQKPAVATKSDRQWKWVCAVYIKVRGGVNYEKEIPTTGTFLLWCN